MHAGMSNTFLSPGTTMGLATNGPRTMSMPGTIIASGMNKIPGTRMAPTGGRFTSLSTTNLAGSSTTLQKTYAPSMSRNNTNYFSTNDVFFPQPIMPSFSLMPSSSFMPPMTGRPQTAMLQRAPSLGQIHTKGASFSRNQMGIMASNPNTARPQMPPMPLMLDTSMMGGVSGQNFGKQGFAPQPAFPAAAKSQTSSFLPNSQYFQQR